MRSSVFYAYRSFQRNIVPLAAVAAKYGYGTVIGTVLVGGVFEGLLGFTASTEAGIWDSFPVAVQSIFSQNVVAVIFVLALLLNLVLPRKLDTEN